MLDRALAQTFRNFATLFFICALVTVPVSVAYAIVFQHEIGLRELHPQIEQFPPLREVKGVSKSDLDRSRVVSGAIAVLELALVPLGLKAARRVFDDAEEGGVTSVDRAWTAAFSKRYSWDPSAPGGGAGIVVTSAIVAVIAGFLLDRLGILITEPLSPTYAFTVAGLATGAARAAAAPLFIGPVAYCCVRKKSIAPDAA
ncbi:MAG: hypothetical protein M3290_12555 [Actinomycetota bacterium]|nr:hypothetical protein [Actinomycetota bacterium]